MKKWKIKTKSPCAPPAPRAKSRGDTLVTRAFIKEKYLQLKYTVSSQYARKNLDLLEQGPRGTGR